MGIATKPSVGLATDAACHHCNASAYGYKHDVRAEEPIVIAQRVVAYIVCNSSGSLVSRQYLAVGTTPSMSARHLQEIGHSSGPFFEKWPIFLAH